MQPLARGGEVVPNDGFYAEIPKHTHFWECPAILWCCCSDLAILKPDLACHNSFRERQFMCSDCLVVDDFPVRLLTRARGCGVQEQTGLLRREISSDCWRRMIDTDQHDILEAFGREEDLSDRRPEAGHLNSDDVAELSVAA